MISGKRGKHAALAAEAWPLYVEEYGLTEYAPTIPRDAAREYMADLKAGRLPRWVQDMAVTKEVKRAARGGDK